MEQINVEEIMDQIRREIKEKGLSSEMLSFDDISMGGSDKGPSEFDLAYFEDKINQVNQGYFVPVIRFYSGNPIKVLIKKIIRKINSCYIVPIMADQNKYNETLMHVANQMELYIEQNEKEKEALKKRIEELEREKA